MALANRQEIADLLFDSAWKALKKTIRVEQNYDPAALMVLHSWNQKLQSHWHAHALVPGGGPISDYRIIAADDHEVTFLAREGKTVGGEDIQVPYTLETPEFVRRWCLHVQPDQLTMTRYFGGWSNTRKDSYLERCAVALDDAGVGIETEIDFDPKSMEETDSEYAGDALVCEHCGSDSLTLVKKVNKPSWKDVFSAHSEACPQWYAASLKHDDRRFWDAAMGEGFSDWYLKSGIESAREPEPEKDRPPATQLEFAWH